MLWPACDVHGTDVLHAGAPPSTAIAPVKVPVPEGFFTAAGVFAHGVVGTVGHVAGPVFSPSPSSPAAFRPQATTLPFGRIARLCRLPAAMNTAPRGKFATFTGVDE